MAAEHRGDRLPEALVGVTDAQPSALEAAGAQAAQELPPERLGLGRTDIEPMTSRRPLWWTP
jgi:hypothetical protein